MKDKYGDNVNEEDIEHGSEGEDDSEDETEDEEGEELTPAVDAAFFRTLARIKEKNPAIYDAQKAIFEGV